MRLGCQVQYQYWILSSSSKVLVKLMKVGGHIAIDIINALIFRSFKCREVSHNDLFLIMLLAPFYDIFVLPALALAKQG